MEEQYNWQIGDMIYVVNKEVVDKTKLSLFYGTDRLNDICIEYKIDNIVIMQLFDYLKITVKNKLSDIIKFINPIYRTELLFLLYAIGYDKDYGEFQCMAANIIPIDYILKKNKYLNTMEHINNYNIQGKDTVKYCDIILYSNLIQCIVKIITSV